MNDRTILEGSFYNIHSFCDYDIHSTMIIADTKHIKNGWILGGSKTFFWGKVVENLIWLSMGFDKS